jgi:hypothetical protein
MCEYEKGSRFNTYIAHWEVVPFLSFLFFGQRKFRRLPQMTVIITQKREEFGEELRRLL